LALSKKNNFEIFGFKFDNVYNYSSFLISVCKTEDFIPATQPIIISKVYQKSLDFFRFDRILGLDAEGKIAEWRIEKLKILDCVCF
jgi:hypothetical protein